MSIVLVIDKFCFMERMKKRKPWRFLGMKIGELCAVIGLIGGPLLAASVFYARGLEFATVAMVLSIFPVALGIDSILTGLRRREQRLSIRNANIDYAH